MSMDASSDEGAASCQFQAVGGPRLAHMGWSVDPMVEQSTLRLTGFNSFNRIPVKAR